MDHNLTCEGCKWIKASRAYDGCIDGYGAPAATKVQHCVRHPPTVIATKHGSSSFYPRIELITRCGEYGEGL